MNKILVKERFSEKVYKLVVEAPLIARARKAGNFVIIRTDQEGERIPLTIATADKEKGTITLVVQAVGYSTIKLCNMNVGDSLADIVGPLGKPTDIQNFGTVVCAGGGVGVAPMLPIVEALKKAGNKVISVLAGRTKELIILEEQIREHSDEVIIRLIRKQRPCYRRNRKRNKKRKGRQVFCHWSCHYDEIRMPSYKEIRNTHRRVAQYYYG